MIWVRPTFFIALYSSILSLVILFYFIFFVFGILFGLLNYLQLARSVKTYLYVLMKN
jgi:hypothetical protein